LDKTIFLICSDTWNKRGNISLSDVVPTQISLQKKCYFCFQSSLKPATIPTLRRSFHHNESLALGIS
jgi:hypothetical protein